MATDPTPQGRLPDHKVIAFGRNVTFAPQQKKNRLVSLVQADMAYAEKGDRYTVEGFGLSDPEETYTDYGDTPASEPIAKHRRVGFFKKYRDDRPVGTVEKAEALIDPTNPTVMAMGWGMERRRDTTILKGLLGPAAYYDEEGDIAYEDFPAANKIGYQFNNLTKGKADGDAAPGTPVEGLTFPKLRKAKILLDEFEFESMSNPKIAVTEEDIQFLKTSVEMSAERHLVNQISALSAGETETFFGFDFVKVKPKQFARAGLTGGASGRWLLPVWYPEACHYKERPLTTMRVWEREEMEFTWWAYYRNQDSFLREYDEGVLSIEVKRGL